LWGGGHSIGYFHDHSNAPPPKTPPHKTLGPTHPPLHLPPPLTLNKPRMTHTTQTALHHAQTPSWTRPNFLLPLIDKTSPHPPPRPPNNPPTHHPSPPRRGCLFPGDGGEWSSSARGWVSRGSFYNPQSCSFTEQFPFPFFPQGLQIDP